MKRKIAWAFIAALLASAVLPFAATAQTAPMTPRQQDAHDQAKTTARGAAQSGGFLDGMAGDKGRTRAANGSLTAPPGTQGSSGAAEALIVACWNEVYSGQVRGQQLSDDCEPAIRGTGLSSNRTSDSSQLIESLCGATIDYDLAPRTRLFEHCRNLLSAKKMNLDSLNGRAAALEGRQQNVAANPRAQPTVTQDDIKNSYSACTTGSQQVAPATMEEEICETSRTSSRGNSCNKTLTARVDWACPAGAISGPTRVQAGTLAAAGRYTCQVQVPRNQYTCPANSTGPSSRVVPPGTQPQQACVRNGDGMVFAATLTVVQDVVTRDATNTVTDQWTSGCAGLEANTPPDRRAPPFGGTVGPMAPFDSSPDTRRCSVSATTCGDVGGLARLVNDVPVTRACWQYNETFDCMNTQVVNQCEANTACTQTSDTCLEWDNASTPRSCTRHEYRRSCQVAPPVVRDVTSCENQTYCPDGRCWDTGYKANNEFGEAISLFSGSQQAARYFNANDFQIFKGYPAACAHRLGLVLNCCAKNWFGDLLYDAVHAAEALRPPSFGSGGGGGGDEQLFNDKTYDFLFAKDSSGQLAAGLRAVGTMKGEAVGIYNDIKDQDWKKAMVRLLITSPKAIIDSGINASIDGIVQMTSLFGLIDGCSEDDKLTQEKKKNHLCIDVGSRCVTEVPITGWCWEREYRSCCFNSMLAKLVNDQGRKQLLEKQIAGQLQPPNLARSLFPANASNPNQRFGTGASPNCLGFSVDQLRAIDFSLLDLTPFLATIDPKLPNKDALIARLSSMYANCAGGTGQCDGNTPESQALDADDSRAAVDRNGSPVPKQLLSLKPLMRQAFALPYGQAAGPAAINSADWRQLRNYRFREADPPVTARVTSLYATPGRADCKVMRVEITRARVTRSWDDKQVPITDANGTVTSWRAAAPGEVSRTTVSGSTSTNKLNGGMAEMPGAWRGGQEIPETTMVSTVSFCADGTVPGVRP